VSEGAEISTVAPLKSWIAPVAVSVIAPTEPSEPLILMVSVRIVRVPNATRSPATATTSRRFRF